LLAFVFPSRVLAFSKVSRSPTLIPSGSIPAAFNSQHIRTTGVVCDKSEAAVGVPHFQFAGGQSISPSP
jgi:hypothetical protein